MFGPFPNIQTYRVWIHFNSLRLNHLKTKEIFHYVRFLNSQNLTPEIVKMPTSGRIEEYQLETNVVNKKKCKINAPEMFLLLEWTKTRITWSFWLSSGTNFTSKVTKYKSYLSNICPICSNLYTLGAIIGVKFGLVFFVTDFTNFFNFSILLKWH